MAVCWLCGNDIEDPPEIVGDIICQRVRVAHFECVRFVRSVEAEVLTGEQ